MEEKQIDLHRREYTAEPMKGEPVFGVGWPVGLAVVVSIFVAAYFFDGTTTGKVIGSILGAAGYSAVIALAIAGGGRRNG